MRSFSRSIVVVAALAGAACSEPRDGSSGAGGTGGSSGSGPGGAASGGAAAGGENARAGAAGSDGACQRVELFKNGNFDLGRGDWTEISGNWPNLIVAADTAGGGAMPHSGSYFARLGGYAGEPEVAQDNLIGTVDVPTSAQSLVFSYYSIVTSQEPSTERRDVLHLALDSDLQYVEQVLDNTIVRPAWQRFEMAIDPMAAGKTLVLLVRAENDTAMPTTFLLDSVSLTASVCP